MSLQSRAFENPFVEHFVLQLPHPASMHRFWRFSDACKSFAIVLMQICRSFIRLQLTMSFSCILDLQVVRCTGSEYASHDAKVHSKFYVILFCLLCTLWHEPCGTMRPRRAPQKGASTTSTDRCYLLVLLSPVRVSYKRRLAQTAQLQLNCCILRSFPMAGRAGERWHEQHSMTSTSTSTSSY